MGSSESKHVEARLHQAVLSNVKFPSKFNIFYQSRSHIRIVLGQDKSNPSKLITLPGGWYGELILYNGRTIEAEPVAVVRGGSRLGFHDSIELAALQPGQRPNREELRSHSNGWSRAYAFAAPVGRSLYPEKFEWRSSHSDLVKELGEGSSGWKLFRLGNRDEIVAAAAEAKFSRALSKVGAFQFVGRGASGELGEAWAVMAVASYVRIVQRRMQAAITAANA